MREGYIINIMRINWEVMRIHELRIPTNIFVALAIRRFAFHISKLASHTASQLQEPVFSITLSRVNLL